jgi:phosphoenolpyruvate carboxykinase (GTP)
VLRRDPMAMLPFCGYNMADYWGHWLAIGERKGAVLPRIYMVNWFRKSPGGDFLWPGYGENSRVLEWVFERCEGTAKAVETPIGNLPERDSLDVAGLDVDAEDMDGARGAAGGTRRARAAARGGKQLSCAAAAPWPRPVRSQAHSSST